MRARVLGVIAAGAVLLWIAADWVVVEAPAARRARAAEGVRQERGQSPPPDFNRQIRPILAENCFACHGPDSAARQADLRLDQRQSVIDIGAIVPSNPDDSLLIARIFATDEGEIMPPPSSHKSLTPEERELLRQWIAAGAEYQPHWSFIAPQRPELPSVKQADWARNPIDRFILATLEAESLAPAPEADRRTLARRASLDITGLPPSPAEVEAFVHDPAANAYERYLDRLFASPHAAEHRARYWLDYARYADTHGIHFDNFRENWAYRDWVIEAFRENMRFDRFTTEQLAGDLLPEPTLEQRVATGFNRCNITTNEGGVIPEEYLVLYTRDRTETVSQVWMGLTAGCAVCHDHKYDPLSQREFYQMAAFFNNTTQGAMDGNIKDTPPVLLVPRPDDRARWNQVVPEIAAATAERDARRTKAEGDFEQWLASGEELPADSVPQQKLHLHLPLAEACQDHLPAVIDGEAQQIEGCGELSWEPGHVAADALKLGDVDIEIADVGDFEKDQPFSCAAWVRFPPVSQNGAVVARLDDKAGHRGWDLWIEGGRVAMHVIHKWPDNSLKVAAREPAAANEWHHVCVTYNGSAKPGGIKIYVDGKPQTTRPANNKLSETIRNDAPLTIGRRRHGGKLNDALVQDVRIYSRALPPDIVEEIRSGTRADWLARKPDCERTPEERKELLEWWLPHLDPEYQAAAARLKLLEGGSEAIKGRGTVAHVTQEAETPPKAYVLYRGEYDQRRDEVAPATPAALPPMPDDLPRSRLGFAQWLLRDEHPLTARVTVNRLWQEVFGQGLVRTSGDFGISGETPSHPELLDWLAVEFRESGWDVQHMIRLMLTSAAYRQSAAVTPEKLELDRDNRLLSRGPRYRLDAETVRDYALAASGLLVREIGGPSVKPYQPPGVWEAVAMIGSNTREYEQESGASLYRRSMYTFWKRSAPPASMEIFNAPSREFCTVRRERTNTPLQALVTMNDPQCIEAARRLAAEALGQAGRKDEARLHFAALRLLSRPLSIQEQQVALGTLAELIAHYRNQPDEAKLLLAVGESARDESLNPVEHAAWTMLVNELMNLDEVLNK
ncbi:MAG: DUF1553 domain-containing protein [Planctomycetota bacterium]